MYGWSTHTTPTRPATRAAGAAQPPLVQARARTSAQGWFWAVAPGPCCGQLCMRPPTHTAQQGQQHTRFLGDWLPGRARPGAAAATHHTRPATHGGGAPASRQGLAPGASHRVGFASHLPPASQKGGGRTHRSGRLPGAHVQAGASKARRWPHYSSWVSSSSSGSASVRGTLQTPPRQSLGNTAQGQWPSTGGPLGNRAPITQTQLTHNTQHTTPRRTEAHAPHKAMQLVLPNTNKSCAHSSHSRVCCRRPDLVAPQTGNLCRRAHHGQLAAITMPPAQQPAYVHTPDAQHQPTCTTVSPLIPCAMGVSSAAAARRPAAVYPPLFNAMGMQPFIEVLRWSRWDAPPMRKMLPGATRSTAQPATCAAPGPWLFSWVHPGFTSSGSGVVCTAGYARVGHHSHGHRLAQSPCPLCCCGQTWAGHGARTSCHGEVKTQRGRLAGVDQRLPLSPGVAAHTAPILHTRIAACCAA